MIHGPYNVSLITQSFIFLVWFVPLCYIIMNTNETLVKHNSLIFIIHCYMFRLNEISLGITLQIFKENKITRAVCIIGQSDLTNIQGVYKRMVQFQKLTRNLFLTLHGHNVHRQQRQLSKFRMRYQQFARSCLLRGWGASLKDGAAAGKGFLCAPFWGVQICDYSAAWVSCTV